MRLALALDQIQRPSWWGCVAGTNKPTETGPTEKERRVLSVIIAAGQPIRCAKIMAETGLIESDVRRTAETLVEKGKVRRIVSGTGRLNSVSFVAVCNA